jgi:uncharacterized membrane protein
MATSGTWEEGVQGIRSRASIGGHPLHPVLVPFPLAFLTGAALTDIVYWQSTETFWAQASFWLLAAGLAGGIAAALLGLIDFVSIPRARQGPAGWVHLIGNPAVLAISLFNLARRQPDPQASILPVGLVLSLLTVALLLITGWFGGELAYRYKIGVIES